MTKLLNSYHDWCVFGVTTNMEKTILELLVGFKDHRAMINFTGVIKCRIDNFLMGNIILDFFVYHGNRYEKNLIEEKSLESLFYMPGEKPFLEKAIKSILDEELMFIELSSSYGCVALILCETVEEIEIK